MKEDIGSGHLILEGKVDFITDRGIVLRVQGVTSEGEGVVYHQEHLGQFDGKLEIPLDSAYSDYVVKIQGLLQWSILGNTVVNGHWVETEVLVRVCDEVGDKYRFGFNGQEKVNEIAGMGNHNTAEFWEYDTRLGRRWNVDPVDQISVSNYAVFRNNPIVFVDPKGDIVTFNSYFYYEHNDGSLRKKVLTESELNKIKNEWNYAMHLLKVDGFGDLVNYIEGDEVDISLSLGLGINSFVLNGNELIYNFRGGLKTSNGNNLSPLTILVHELDHIWSANSNPEYAELKNISDNKYTNKEEKRVITGIEQVAAKIFGDIKDGETTRENHGGQYFEAYNLKSNRESKKGYNVPLGLRNPSKLNKEKSQKKNEENTDFLRVDYYK